MQIYEINFASNPATQGYSKVSQNVPTLIRPAQPQSARTQAQTQAEPEKGMFGHLKDILKKKKRDQETGYFSKEFGVDPKLFMTKKELEDLRAEEEGKKLQQTTVAKTPVAPTPTPTSTQSQATVSATSNSNTAAPAAPAAPAALLLQLITTFLPTNAKDNLHL